MRAVEVCSAAAISGNAGRYISMENGLIVESAPRIMMIKRRFLDGDINGVRHQVMESEFHADEIAINSKIDS